MARVGDFNSVVADEKNGPFDFTIDGKCSGCGECCSNFLPISTHEVKRIKSYIEKHKIAEQVSRLPVSGPQLDLTCPFRDNVNRQCLIYSVRPEICKTFLCNAPQETIQNNKKLFNGKYNAVDMRSVFYGHKETFTELLNAMLQR